MEDLQVYYGGAVKALEDGRIGGYLVEFTGPDAKDKHGQYFDAKGYYGPSNGNGAEALFEHGFPVAPANASPQLKEFLKSLADETFAPLKTRLDEGVGIYGETKLDLSNPRHRIVYKYVQDNELSWSSGAAGHRVKVDSDGRITRWPIAEGSLTSRPANPRSLGKVMALKSYQGECVAERWEALLTASVAPSNGIFERELATQKRSTLDLWATFYKCVGDIAKAATTADVTGVPVDTEVLVTGVGTEFIKNLTPIITAEIKDYLTRPTEEPFYLKGSQDARLKSLLTNSDVAFRDSLPDHSKAVASAVEEFAALSTPLVESVKDYAGRTERKSAFRLKEGRMLSKANVDQMDSTCGSLDVAIENLTAIRTTLKGLIERARKPEVEEVKSVNDEKAQALRTQYLRMQAARLGIELAA